MLSLPPSVCIIVARRPIDMRGSFDGLSAAVTDVVRGDPRSARVLALFDKSKSHVECLVLDRSGYLIHYERPERRCLRVLDHAAGARGAFELRAHEFALVFEGIDLPGSKRPLSHAELHRAGEPDRRARRCAGGQEDEGRGFISHRTRAMPQRYGILVLASPASCRSYNGSCEQGNGSIKARPGRLAAKAR